MTWASAGCSGLIRAALVVALVMWLAPVAWAQSGGEGGSGKAGSPAGQYVDLTNPISILDNASKALPGQGGGGLTGLLGGASNAPADVPAGGNAGASGGLSTGLSILLLLTVLTVAPSILVMTTSFTRIVVVLSLLRQAIGTQTLPPSQVIVGLSLFLTLLVMAPTFERINREAIQPLEAHRINQMQAWEAAKQPLRDFMFAQIDNAHNWDDVYLILDYRGITKPRDQLTRGDVDMLTLIPAYILSELKVAFLMGFRLYLPFLIIDMVISSVLLSMGMMMLPPVLVSLPFKLLLFVMVDGWRLVVGTLLHSFATVPVPGLTT